ncbi:hypothetical protein N7466_001460 [Penicillium verhagenii]|uniref:uncharacterized protein n=1 Tax=Penicillium verhagenii TaxID=1562060 RepID=UPI002544DCDE|nr:uncharacterized protein N7466_001460 [Penicillium verhagenii]KAJ5938326.1 hypothetical protein N7466_001460 [Penicillium verhagenii]
MHVLSIAILVIIHACTSRAGVLEVIDYNRECLIWSNGNYGCTGYSASFALLDGDDCSKLSEKSSALSVDVCGTEDGSPAAWIQVNHTGLVTFYNKNGNISTCVLNKGLKAGSWCIASETEVSTTNLLSYSAVPTTLVSVTNKSLSTTLSIATPSTATPSTATPSTATPSTATPSTATPSTATPSTATPSTATPSIATTSIATPSTATPSTATPSTATPSTATPSNSSSSSATLSNSFSSTTTLCTATTEKDIPTVVCEVVAYPLSTITMISSCSSSS